MTQNTATKGRLDQKNNLTKTGGGKFMKKIQNNKKGFSLVELLIVLAILAIIAAISISIFANVLENQRQRADKGAASFIQSAIQTYMVESGDTGLTGITTTDLQAIVNSLKVAVEFTNPDTGEDGTYGPYCKESTLAETKSDKYEGGFDVTIDTAAQSVSVVPSEDAATFTVN